MIKSHTALAENSAPKSEILVHPDEDEVIYVECRGLPRPEQVDACVATLQPMFDVRHARGERVRLLADNRMLMLHRADTAERIRVSAERIYGQCDKVAIILSARLAEIQMKRILGIFELRFFDNRPAAIAWLRADDIDLAACVPEDHG